MIRMNRRLNGYHVTAMFVAFFAIVIAVNLLMAHFATSTFGGALAENGYVASQDYNRFIADSEAQAKLGWDVVATEENAHLYVTVTGVRDPRLSVLAEHPLGRKESMALAMLPVGEGTYRSVERLPEGRWKLRIELTANGKTARFLDEIGR